MSEASTACKELSAFMAFDALLTSRHDNDTIVPYSLGLNSSPADDASSSHDFRSVHDSDGNVVGVILLCTLRVYKNS